MASLDPTASTDALAADWVGPHDHAQSLAPSRAPGVLATISSRLAREAPLILTVTSMLVLWAAQPWQQIAADTWLNLLGGREILRHGLPHTDTLAVISHGYHWIDQQWLANLAYYGLYVAGGKALVASANILVFTGSIGLVFLVVRRSGTPAFHTAICGLPAAFIAPQFARAEVLVQPLFVLLIALLASESRRKTRRVWLVFPILALWANLHGSVVVAALLVALLGLIEVLTQARSRRSSWRGALRAAFLVCAPWAFIFASPYGLDLVAYYRATLHNPMFAKFLTEWAAPTFNSPWGFTLFSLAGVTIFLIARAPRVLTSFELTALAVTLLSGLVAARSIVWFTYAGAIMLPRFFQSARTRDRSSSEKALLATTAALATAVAAIVVTVSMVSPQSAIAHDREQRGLDSVARVLKADPNARVFASYDLADWLLFNVPDVRGRIAYDGRWEILPAHQMGTLVSYLMQVTPAWERPSRGYRLIVLNPQRQQSVIHTYRRRQSMRVLYADKNVVVFDRGVGKP